jgi:hypothetical protein
MRRQSDKRTEDLDQLLDAALESYATPAEAEDSHTLAIGVIASVRHAESQRRQWRWGFAVGLPALAALLIAAVLFTGSPHTPTAPVARKSPAVVTLPDAINPAVARIPVLPQVSLHKELRKEVARLTRTPQTVPVQRNLPKLEQFPSPQPLSPQEALLEKFARSSAPAEKAAIVKAQQAPTQPLEIAEIQIKPLSSDTDTETENKTSPER